MDNITREIVPLAFMAVFAFFMWGIGYLIVADMKYVANLKSECIAAGKQVVEGNCVD